MREAKSRLSAAPVLLGMAAGLLYGVQDALTRMSGQRFGSAAGRGVHQLAAVRGAGARHHGLILVQSAFEMAPLRMSLPALTAAQPLAGIACGVGFLGDQLRTDAGALAWQAAGLAGDRGGDRAARAASGDAATGPREGDRAGVGV